MTTQQDSDAIAGLFDRIEDVARNAAPRDRDAEVLIQQRLQDFPPAPYYLAQTVIIQEQALKQAQQRIEELEAGQRQGSGGFLGGLFGGEQPQAQQRQPARQDGPWGRRTQEDEQQRGGRFGGGGGGGFLAGAAQTAMGVAGGVLLGSAIAGMLTGGANAEEYTPNDDQAADDQGGDAPADDFQGDDGGFGGGDDFDMGGDF